MPAGRAFSRSARRSRHRSRWLTIALFLLPALVLYGLLVIAPVVQAIYYSGFRWNGLGSLDDFVGLENFRRAFNDDVFIGALKHNGFFIVMSILLAASVVAPANAALWYNPDTNQFEERSASATSRGGSPIKKQIVDYETTQKPGTIIIETGERRLYLVLEGGKAIQFQSGRDGRTIRLERD